MGERIDVSVVISTYNGGSVLPCALDSILNQDAPDVAYEVIVVDNNSTTRATSSKHTRPHRTPAFGTCSSQDKALRTGATPA